MNEEMTYGKLEFGKALSDAFDLLKSNFVLLVVASLLGSLVSTFCFLLFGAMFMGMFAVCDRLAINDEKKPVVGDVFKGFSFFLPGLVLMLFGLLGVIACYVGVFITMPVAILAMLRIVDKGVTIGESIKFGFDVIFKQKQWMFILLMIVAGIISSLGAVLCGVGVILTAPLYYLIFVCAYRQICPKA